MANFFSDVLTSINAGNRVDAGTIRGNILSSTAVVNILVEPSVSDVFLYTDLPSNSRPQQLLFRNDDMDNPTNTVAVDIGIYASADFKLADGTTFLQNDVILVDAFGKDENSFFQDNRMVGEDFRFSTVGANSNTGLSNAQDYLWELAGLTSDPGVDLRIGIKITGAFTDFVAGTSLLIAQYTGRI